MASKSSFENQFSDYNTDISSNILNESKDGISDLFLKKLQSFKESKLDLLTTKMEKDIFYDGTVYTGSAGWALFYLLSALEKKEGWHETLQIGLQYVNVDNLKGRRISFLCGDAGPLAIATVISYKLASRSANILPDYRTLSARLIDLISILEDSPDELLYGKSGYLYALLFVNKHLNGKDVIPSSHIEKVVSSIIRSGKQFSREMKSESPLLWQWHGKIYLGAAHGMSGILYMLLQPTIDLTNYDKVFNVNLYKSGEAQIHYTPEKKAENPLALGFSTARAYINGNEIRSFVKPALDWLLNQKYPSGNFPSSLNSSSGDRLVQWCHGAPGFVSLCCLAYLVFEEEKYLKIALSCGEVIWQRGLCTKGYSICHGVSGNAYSFLELYQITKKPVHLYRACCFMEWCALERRGTELHRPDRPASLFEGTLGRIYLAEQIVRPLEARFPAYSL